MKRFTKTLVAFSLWGSQICMVAAQEAALR